MFYYLYDKKILLKGLVYLLEMKSCIYNKIKPEDVKGEAIPVNLKDKTKGFKIK